MICMFKKKKRFIGTLFLGFLACFFLLFSQNESYRLFLAQDAGISYTVYSFCLVIPTNGIGGSPPANYTKILPILAYLNLAFSSAVLSLGYALDGYYKLIFFKNSSLASFARAKLIFVLKVFCIPAAIVIGTVAVNYLILSVPIASIAKEIGFLCNVLFYFLALFITGQLLANSKRGILLIFELGALLFIVGNLIMVHFAILPVILAATITASFLITANSRGEA